MGTFGALMGSLIAGLAYNLSGRNYAITFSLSALPALGALLLVTTVSTSTCFSLSAVLCVRACVRACVLVLVLVLQCVGRRGGGGGGGVCMRRGSKGYRHGGEEQVGWRKSRGGGAWAAKARIHGYHCSLSWSTARGLQAQNWDLVTNINANCLG